MQLYSDAGVRGNGQGYLQQGVVVVTDISGKVIFEEFINGKTINQLELWGVYQAILHGGKQIFTDSQIVRNWFYKNKMPSLKPTSDPDWDLEAIGWYQDVLPKARKEKNKRGVSIVWIKRDKNKAGHYIENKYGM
jgi:ribonuclease HI